ncbi:hypothetical protein DKX38_018322 [Salix brachista]|uniref:NAC domain-containing protein n=1 Tax=Salix brachista TaxID=2182728 RepID=A0A5N5KMQ2_9ROSI|nr:hypothetical protein DKX38_018322 [Salix brachista]
MENICGLAKEDDEKMDMPPGFRFHPTDEELISHYLYKKVLDIKFSARAIGDVDLNKSEPWELPWKAKMGEKEWYFFCVRDRKYPTGLRTNRATEAGYWKATGKDKEIYRGKSLVGMKKTLVFYTGRAPKGEKTNWVMHEYRLEGKFAVHNLPKTAKNEWVICRVFQKSSAGKKTYISGLVRPGSFGSEFSPSGLPPLTDSSPYNGNIKSVADSAYVPCFSNLVQRNQQDTIDSFSNHLLAVSSNPSEVSPRIPLLNSFYSPQAVPASGNLQYSASQDSATDMNTEISSVISNLEVGNRSFDEQEMNLKLKKIKKKDEPQVEEDQEKELQLLLLLIVNLKCRSVYRFLGSGDKLKGSEQRKSVTSFLVGG